MRFLKNLISFLIPLFIVLTTFALYSAIVDVVNDYKKTIIDDYAIMIVTNTPLVKEDLKSIGTVTVRTIEDLKREDIIKDMKDQLSTNSLKLLKQKLPFFYKIYLYDYPTTSQLKQIKNNLKELSNIKRVETFSSDHNKIYSLLILCEQIILVALFFIIIFAVLILSKQISIWFFEHSKRIKIAELHGGSLLYSSEPILRIIAISALISSIIAYLIILLYTINGEIFVPSKIIPYLPSIGQMHYEFLKIIFLSITIPIVTYLGLLIKYKMK